MCTHVVTNYIIIAQDIWSHCILEHKQMGIWNVKTINGTPSFKIAENASFFIRCAGMCQL